MSENFEDYLRSQTLKQPSAGLDDKILSLFDENEAPEVKEFPWQKFLTYAVAAMLFLSVGVAEVIQRTNAPDNSTVQTAPVSDSSVVVPTIKVSTSGTVNPQEEKKLLKK